jgi:AcrR family transcriptional regulator
MGRRPFVADRILESAFDLIAREGFEAVSTRAIAQAAGVGHASMYKHFPSMEALGRALYARAVGPILDEAAAIMAQPAPTAERCAGLVRLLYAAYDHRPRALALIIFPPHVFTPDELSATNPRSLRACCIALCAGDADRAAVLWGAITGPLIDRYLHQRAGAMTPVAETLLPLIIDLLPEPA